MSYHTAESKKEEFRRYLERSGAFDSLTSVLVSLYEESERPLESTNYIKQHIGGNNSIVNGSSVGDDADQLHSPRQQPQQQLQDNDKLRKENKELRDQVRELARTIETLKSNLKHSREEAKQARSQNQSQ